KSGRRPYSKLDRSKLAALGKELDQEFAIDVKTRPLTKAERELWKKTQVKLRERRGRTDTRTVRVRAALLERASKQAKRLRISTTKLVNQLLERGLNE
ncbi:MAG TPA: hypothetical protein VIK18_17285, partial [Pirellulales bacterium]